MENSIVEDIIEDAKISEAKTQNHENTEYKIPPFPYEVFPKSIQKIIYATNESLNYPIDFIGASILYAASVAIGNSHRVEVKREFLESAVLYMTIVARTGTNKSHPLTFALKPLKKSDEASYHQYELMKLEYDRLTNLSKKDRDEEKSIIPPKPFWQKKLLSDFTPEALAEVHKYNKRGIGVYVDEFAGWFKNFNRYNSGSEMEFWLSTWSVKPIIIDRKTGDPIYISLPFISVVGTIQKSILVELAKDNRSQNGFIDRILFVYPDNLQKPYWNDIEIDEIYIKNWNSIISNLMDLTLQFDDEGNPEPQILRFTTEAKEILYNWQRKNTDQCNNAESEELSGVYSKFDIHAIRFSLLLEMLFWACNESDREAIGCRAIMGAIKLAEYFKKTALKVNSIISNPIANLKKVEREIYQSLPDIFKRTEGMVIANNFKMSKRTFCRFLNKKDLFDKAQTGIYEKLY